MRMEMDRQTRKNAVKHKERLAKYQHGMDMVNPKVRPCTLKKMRRVGKRILCLDGGGGVKGFVLIEMIRQIEKDTGLRVGIVVCFLSVFG